MRRKAGMKNVFNRFKKKTPDYGIAFICKRKQHKKIISSDVFEFMNAAYAYIGGFKSFTGEDDFIDKSYLWYITYDGKLNNIQDFDVDKCYTVSVYKNKHGLKMIGVGNNRFLDLDEEERKERRRNARSAIIKHLNFGATHGWMEVSEKMEDLCNRYLGYKYLILPEKLIENGVYKESEIEILPDMLHYRRKLTTGKEVTKIAFGTI